jgi:hypothetical protein
MACWPLLIGFNLGVISSLMVAASLVVTGLLRDQPALVTCFGILLLLHFGGLLGALVVTEKLIRTMARCRGQLLPPLATPWEYLAGTGLAMALHGLGLVDALLARQVTWRGIDYALGGMRHLRLMEYRPYKMHCTSDRNQSVL